MTRIKTAQQILTQAAFDLEGFGLTHEQELRVAELLGNYYFDGATTVHGILAPDMSEMKDMAEKLKKLLGAA